MPLNRITDFLAEEVDKQTTDIPADAELSKIERLTIVCRVLENLKPRFDAEALWLLNVVFMIVEDRFTQAPFRSDGANHTERMYGPSKIQLKKGSMGPAIWEFWAVAHVTWMGQNGAMRIAVRRSKQTILDIPGADGVRLPDIGEPP